MLRITKKGIKGSEKECDWKEKKKYRKNNVNNK